MNNFYKAGILAIAALFAVSAQAGTAKNGYDKQKVVYHLDDINSADGALRNVKNHLNAVGDENVEIIVVTHSSGAFALVDGSMGKKDKDGKPYDFKDTIAGLANRGVKFQICANTIKGKKIDQNKIDAHAEVVPSGVAQIIHLEQKGYLYIRP